MLSRGDWLIFTDDDCIPEPGFIESYKKAITDHPDVKVFEGRIFPDRERRTWAEGCPENSSGGMLWTSNLCIKKSLFDEIGGFDERFRVAYEDVEFAHRLKQNKIQSKFVNEAAVCHPWRSLRSGGKNWKTKGYQIESLLLFLEKHKDAHNEFGRPALYLKNFIRIISKNLFTASLNLEAEVSTYCFRKHSYLFKPSRFWLLTTRVINKCWPCKRTVMISRCFWDYYLHVFQKTYAYELKKSHDSDVIWVDRPTRHPMVWLKEKKDY